MAVQESKKLAKRRHLRAGGLKGVYKWKLLILGILENQMEKKMEDEMEIGEYIRNIIRVLLGLYRDNGKENGSYYLGFRAVKGLGFRGLGFAVYRAS